MIVDRNEVNAGEMKMGSSATFNVVLRNSYPEKVKVTAVNKSCTCTVATLEGPSELAPGEQSLVVITITPGSTGIFSRQAIVHFERDGYGAFSDNIALKAIVTE